MLGWWILIQRRVPDGQDDTGTREVTVATWTVGLGGLDWLNDLVVEGRAVDLGGNGYPDRYTITAGELRKVISAGPPRPKGPDVIGDDYFRPGNWIGRAEVNRAELDACPEQEILEVEAWDES